MVDDAGRFYHLKRSLIRSGECSMQEETTLVGASCDDPRARLHYRVEH